MKLGIKIDWSTFNTFEQWLLLTLFAVSVWTQAHVLSGVYLAGLLVLNGVLRVLKKCASH